MVSFGADGATSSGTSLAVTSNRGATACNWAAKMPELEELDSTFEAVGGCLSLSESVAGANPTCAVFLRVGTTAPREGSAEATGITLGASEADSRRSASLEESLRRKFGRGFRDFGIGARSQKVSGTNKKSSIPAKATTRETTLQVLKSTYSIFPSPARFTHQKVHRHPSRSIIAALTSGTRFLPYEISVLVQA